MENKRHNQPIWSINLFAVVPSMDSYFLGEQLMKVSKKLRTAFKQYYDNRNRQSEVKWDKQADLENIERSLPKRCMCFQATAGTFWLTWSSPKIQTTHSEGNYWCGKVLARFNRKERRWISNE